MKVYIAVHSNGADNKQQIETLCRAVHDAKLKVFCFVRDIENYKDKFENPKERWDKIYDELGACDALLVDTTDNPTGGRLLEIGMAYAMRKPVIVVKKEGSEHKKVLSGVASKTISYKDMNDLTKQLVQFDTDHNYNTTDKTTLFVMFLLLGGVITWGVSQFFIPLAPIAAVGYWLIVRQTFVTLRAFDRVVIYIPLTVVWWAGFYYLYIIDLVFSLAWTTGYWLFVLAILKKMKYSL